MDAELMAYLDKMQNETEAGQDRPLKRIDALEKDVAGLRAGYPFGADKAA